MTLHPQQFWCREAGQRTVAGERDQLVARDALLDDRALLCRPLVVPEDGWPQNAIGGVEGDQAVHLAGEPDAGRRR
jgi:hypothetical protein